MGHLGKKTSRNKIFENLAPMTPPFWAISNNSIMTSSLYSYLLSFFLIELLWSCIQCCTLCQTHRAWERRTFKRCQNVLLTAPYSLGRYPATVGSTALAFETSKFPSRNSRSEILSISRCRMRLESPLTPPCLLCSILLNRMKMTIALYGFPGE